MKYLLAAPLFMFMAGLLYAADPNEPQAPPPPPPGQMQISQDRAAFILDRIAETDPARADQLRQLQKQDPPRFAQELRKEMHGRFGRRGPMGPDAQQPPAGPASQAAPGQPGSPAAPDRPGQKWVKRTEVKERLENMHNEFIKWLEKNYPEDAAKLADIKEKTPEQYFGKLKEAYEKYGRIARADKDNPELAKVLREDLKVKLQVTKLLEDLRASTDENQKKELTAGLQDLVAQRFDLILQQKQLHYQELNQKIEKLKLELKKQETELQKFKAKKDQEVKKRVDELLSQSESFKWE